MMWIFLSNRVLHVFLGVHSRVAEYHMMVIYASVSMGDRWINDEQVLELIKS